MPENERLVAVVSPWEKMSEIAKRKFRVETLPAEKMVMVWRDDLPTEQELLAELAKIGIVSPELRKRGITEWRGVE